jgi:hypothetical protein
MTKMPLLLALAALPMARQDSPFNGENFSGWKFKGGPTKSKWTVGKAELDPASPYKLVVKKDGNEMINAEGHGCDISTEARWGDAVIEVEVMLAKGQNSGIYLMGEYEVQVLDSFGKEKVGAGDMGGLYGVAAPKLNACKAPGEWQKFVIDYRAPKFDEAGKKASNLKIVKIELNGQIIHENLELKGPTPGGLSGREAPTGPIMFQGDHGIVAYRNLKVSPVK